MLFPRIILLSFLKAFMQDIRYLNTVHDLEDFFLEIKDVYLLLRIYQLFTT